MLLLQEVKIATKDMKTQDAVRAAVNASNSSLTGNQEPQYEAYFTLPNDPHNARGLRGSGKVYGVCSIIRRDLREKLDVNVRTVDWDSEGRISVIELTSGEKKLAVFNIYAVNGTENPYRDPKTGAQRGTRHGRKLAFHKLLSEEFKKLENKGWNVLLGGDMNVAPDARDGYPKLRTFPHQHVLNRADFHDKLLQVRESEESFSGVDVWRKMHGDERRYTYYPRGREWGTSCDRVDYFVTGRRAWDSGMIRGSGILDSEAERGPSDHIPVWVDIAFSHTHN
jgi:exonuclease III